MVERLVSRDLLELPETAKERVMGYFSNGTEGDIYSEKYCEKCVHPKIARFGERTYFTVTMKSINQIPSSMN
ncbi:hypothetical protein LCGC14_1018230 [marine sediment metagenome]|uniref:Uncharacterized protein n=1 Tax=marine sediment metagenome TaxID=412755 RepID=A0A0F9QGJ5_9ZZZZ